METITRAIQFILAPVVMVTSCAILLGGMLMLYGGLNDRLRVLAKERLELLRGPRGSLDASLVQGDAYKSERRPQFSQTGREFLGQSKRL